MHSVGYFVLQFVRRTRGNRDSHESVRYRIYGVFTPRPSRFLIRCEFSTQHGMPQHTIARTRWENFTAQHAKRSRVHKRSVRRTHVGQRSYIEKALDSRSACGDRDVLSSIRTGRRAHSVFHTRRSLKWFTSTRTVRDLQKHFAIGDEGYEDPNNEENRIPRIKRVGTPPPPS